MNDHLAKAASVEALGLDKPVVAVKFVRRMPGMSQSSLIEASDRNYYVVKTWGDPRLPNNLANEYLGTALTRGVGLPVNCSRQVYLSKEFLEQWDLSLVIPGCRIYPQAGFHFGSRLGGIDCDVQMGYISRCNVHSVLNRADFLGMYLLDIWGNHLDYRQAVFTRTLGQRGLTATFIDFSHMFGGPNWHFQDRKIIACHHELSLYTGLWTTRAVNSWLRILRKRVPRIIETVVPTIPAEWFSGNIVSLTELLLQRLDRIDWLIAQHSLATILSSKGSTANDQVYLPDPVTCPVGVGG